VTTAIFGFALRPGIGGVGGIAAASISDNYWLAGGLVGAAAVVAVVIHYATRD